MYDKKAKISICSQKKQIGDQIEKIPKDAFDRRKNLVRHTFLESRLSAHVLAHDYAKKNDFFRLIQTQDTLYGLKALNGTHLIDCIKHMNARKNRFEHFLQSYMNEPEQLEFNRIRALNFFKKRGRIEVDRKLINPNLKNSLLNQDVGIMTNSTIAGELIDLLPEKMTHGKGLFNPDHSDHEALSAAFKKSGAPFICGASGSLQFFIMDLERNKSNYDQHFFEEAILLCAIMLVAGGHHSLGECLLVAKAYNYFSDIPDPRENYYEFLKKLFDCLNKYKLADASQLQSILEAITPSKAKIKILSIEEPDKKNVTQHKEKEDAISRLINNIQQISSNFSDKYTLMSIQKALDVNKDLLNALITDFSNDMKRKSIEVELEDNKKIDLEKIKMLNFFEKEAAHRKDIIHHAEKVIGLTYAKLKIPSANPFFGFYDEQEIDLKLVSLKKEYEQIVLEKDFIWALETGGFLEKNKIEARQKELIHLFDDFALSRKKEIKEASTAAIFYLKNMKGFAVNFNHCHSENEVKEHVDNLIASLKKITGDLALKPLLVFPHQKQSIDEEYNKKIEEIRTAEGCQLEKIKHEQQFKINIKKIDDAFSVKLNNLDDELRKNGISQKKKEQLLSVLKTAQNRLFQSVDASSTKVVVTQALKEFSETCQSITETADKMMGHGWLYRCVEVVFKAIVGLFLGIGMAIVYPVGLGFGNEKHKQFYKDTVLKFNQTAAQNTLGLFKNKIKDLERELQEVHQELDILEKECGI